MNFVPTADILIVAVTIRCVHMKNASTNRLILITGVTRGLGRAMADELIRLGHTIVGCGRAVSYIEEMIKQYGKPHRFDAVDVADDGQVREWAQAVMVSHGAPDLVLNNAALANQPAALWEVPDEEFSRIIDVNIKGVYHVIRQFVPAMIERGSGVVVNFSSGWGRSTDPEVAPYCTTKWAIEGLTQALAQELPRGVAAVAYSPGIIQTDMLDICFGREESERYPSPAEWAKQAVPFLLGLGPHHNGRSLGQ